MKMKILGYKHSKGNFEGTEYNYVKLFSIARLETKEIQQGGAGVDMRGIPELLPVLRKQDLWNGGQGVEFDVVTEAIAKGGGNTQEMVVGLKLLQPVKS